MYRQSGNGHPDYANDLRQSSNGHLDYAAAADRVQYSERQTPNAGGYSTDRKQQGGYSDVVSSPGDRGYLSATSDRTGCTVVDGGGGGTVVRVSVTGGGGEGVTAVERGPPAGSHRVLLKLRHERRLSLTARPLIWV